MCCLGAGWQPWPAAICPRLKHGEEVLAAAPASSAREYELLPAPV